LKFTPAEAQAKRLGVCLVGKTEHLPPLVLITNAVAAQRKVEAERVERSVLRRSALFGAERHLIRPAAIDPGR
jgi:hypothetical protein